MGANILVIEYDIQCILKIRWTWNVIRILVDGFTQKDMPLLYNVEHDPSEKYNIVKENKEIVKVLNDLASEHIQSVLKTPSQYDEILPPYQSAYNEYNKK